MTNASADSNPSTFVPRFPSGLARNLAIDMLLPWLAVQLLSHRAGWSAPAAIAVAALFPAASITINAVRRRRLEWIGLVVLVTLAGAVGVVLLTGDVRMALLKAVPGAALFGLACLLSLPARRPLMFFVARQFTAGDDPAKLTAWNARVDSAGFRRGMRLLTLVWGTAFLVKSAMWAACAYFLPLELALIAIPAIGFAVLGALFAWTIAYARRRAGAAP